MAFPSTPYHDGNVTAYRKLLPGRAGTKQRSSRLPALEGARTEQELYDIAFMRLQPIELDGGNGSDVQAIDVGPVEQRALELRVFGYRGADQRPAHFLQHLFLRAFHHADKREH